MAGMGVPSIASPLPSYREARTAGTGAIVLEEHSATAWEAALRLLIDDRAYRERLAREALAFALTRDINRRCDEWLEAYKVVLDGG
jgi:glycosyltransferase involved in cell wall biosynthesis